METQGPSGRIMTCAAYQASQAKILELRVAYDVERAIVIEHAPISWLLANVPRNCSRYCKLKKASSSCLMPEIGDHRYESIGNTIVQ